MAENSIDVLMRVVGPGGPLAAESNTKFQGLSMSDMLRKGFTPGFFCELRTFNFSAGVAAALGEEKLSETQRNERSRRKRLKEKDREEKRALMNAAERREDAVRNLVRKQEKAVSKRSTSDFVDMQPVEFTRVMDSMSMSLFQSLADCDTLNTISVVKRKAAGTRQSGDCYLRLDFERVLLTDLDWKDEEHMIVESGTFIYRKVSIKYRPQNVDGTLGPISESSWEMQSNR